MLPRHYARHWRQRRSVAGILAVFALLGLAACAQESDVAEAPQRTASAPEDVADPSAINEVSCTEAPPLPDQLPTFSLTQAPAAAAPDLATVELGTNCGPVTLELDGAAAPQTVASFLLLADSAFYEDSPCHRLVDGGTQVLQCGDPTGTGRGGPGYTFGIENAPADGVYPRGTIAMARSQDPDSNGSQFFIVYGDTTLPLEGGGYSIFGRVTDGMEIIDYIAAQGVDGGGIEGMPAQQISILDVEAEEETPSS